MWPLTKPSAPTTKSESPKSFDLLLNLAGRYGDVRKQKLGAKPELFLFKPLLRAARYGGRRRQVAAFKRSDDTLEHPQKSQPAGIDHPGLFKHRQLLWSLLKGLVSGFPGVAENVQWPCRSSPRRTLGGGPNDRQDGALDRFHDGGVGAARGFP